MGVKSKQNQITILKLADKNYELYHSSHKYFPQVDYNNRNWLVIDLETGRGKDPDTGYLNSWCPGCRLYGKVSTNTIIYSQPTIDSEPVSNITENADVKFLDINNKKFVQTENWYLVEWEGHKGYIQGCFIAKLNYAVAK